MIESAWYNLGLAFNISRRVGWVIAPLVFLIGLVYSGGSISYYSLIQLVLLSFPYSVMLFGINDLNDYESDIINPRKKSAQDPRHKNFIYVNSFVAALGLLCVAVILGNKFNIFSVVVLLFVSYFYSAYPLRLKEIPLIDSISNGLIFLAVFSIGYSFGGSLSEIPAKIYFVALCVMGIHAFGAAVDCETDKEAGHKTLAVYIGKRGALLFASSTFIVSYIYSGIGSYIINLYLLFCSILALTAFLFPYKRLEIILFKMIFAGFIVTSTVFLINYSKA